MVMRPFCSSGRAPKLSISLSSNLYQKGRPQKVTTELDSLFEIRAKTAYSATSLGCSRPSSTIGPMLGVQKNDLRQGPGDRLSDPPVGTCVVPTAEAILGIRLLHTPCEKREGAEAW